MKALLPGGKFRYVALVSLSPLRRLRAAEFGVDAAVS